MTTTGLEIKLLADSSAFRNAALDAADALDKVAASGSRIVDPLVVVSEQATVVADSLQKTADSFEKTNALAAATSGVFETSASAASGLSEAALGVAERLKNGVAFAQNMAEKTRVIVAGLDEAAAAAGDFAADVGMCTRATGEGIGALGIAISAGLSYAFAIVQKAARIALTDGIAFQSALAQAAVAKLKVTVATLYSQFTLLAVLPGLIAMTAYLEASRQETASALGETTRFQDALAKALEVWNRWSEALAGPTLDIVATSLSVVADVFGTIRGVIDGIERIPVFGAMVSAVESVTGALTVLVGVLAAAYAISKTYFGAGVIEWVKKIIALATATRSYTAAEALATAQKKIASAWSSILLTLGIKKAAATAGETLALKLWASATALATAAQVAWNAAKTFALSLTGVGIALVVAAAAASAAYAASARVETAESFGAAMAELGDKAAITKDRYVELTDEIKRANDEARTPTEAYRAELDAIQERVDAQRKATSTIAAYQEKERELSDLLAGASGSLTRQQRKDATERLEKLREEREEFEKSYDANLKYSEAARTRDRETARQNALSSLGIADLVDQKTAAETRDEKLESLKTALDAKLIDEARYKEAVEKVVAEFEETDEEAKKVAEANKKFAKILETNAQKAAEVYAVLDEGIVREEDRAKIEDALNDELLRASENGKYYADALKSNVPFSERLTAELDDLTETVGLLKDGSKSTAEREAALADARAKLTESLLSETETGKFLIDAQKAQTSVADRLSAAMLEMEANAKAVGTSDETLAAAKTKLTESILQQTEAGKYLLQAEKNLIPKTERLQKAYEEIEATARATEASEDAVAEAKRLAEEDILGKGSPETKAQKEDKPGSNAAAYFGSTAALDAANNRREDKQTPLLKEIATASKKTSAALETVAQKEEPEVFNG